METRDLVLRHLVPGLGAIIALIMFISPLQAVLKIRRSKALGDFNPLPLVAIIANCTGWLLYGCLIHDPYVIAANEPGLLFGVFMAFTCYGYADAKRRELMLMALLFFTAVLSSSGVVISLALNGMVLQARLFAGCTAVFILLCYYSAPLSTMGDVLRRRNSASLYWPLSIMSCVNGSLWVAYAVAVHDAFILYPNLIGALLGVVQIVLIMVYPSKSASPAGLSDGDERSPLNSGTTSTDVV